MVRTILVAALLAMFATQSEASRSHKATTSNEFCGDRYCSGNTEIVVERVIRTKVREKIRRTRDSFQSAEILPHPEGCPRRAFCGCGVALKLFGKLVTQGGLAIAANWLKFPPADPAPGMVAARRGHVFLIEKVLGNGNVLAYDPNSGGHKTRRHVRNLAGYSVRNPNG